MHRWTVGIFILASLASAAERSIVIVGDDHEGPACTEQKRTLVAQAKTGEISLGLEGVPYDDPEAYLEAYVGSLRPGTWDTDKEALLRSVFGLESLPVYNFGGYLLYSQHLAASYVKFSRATDDRAKREASDGINRALAPLGRRAGTDPSFRATLLASFEKQLKDYDAKEDLLQHILRKVRLQDFIAALSEGYVAGGIRSPEDRATQNSFFYRYLNRVLETVAHPEEQRIFDRDVRAAARDPEKFPLAKRFPEIVLYDVLWRNQTYLENLERRLSAVEAAKKIYLVVGQEHAEDLAQLIRGLHAAYDVTTSYDCVSGKARH